MNKLDNITLSIVVESDGGIVEITSLLKLKKEGGFEICPDTTYLTFHKTYKKKSILFEWDNQDWIEGLGKALKKKKKNKYYRDLKEDCKKFNLDFKSIKVQVLECYLGAKKAGMFN